MHLSLKRGPFSNKSKVSAQGKNTYLEEELLTLAHEKLQAQILNVEILYNPI
jgi:hypothetical protein